MVSTAWARGRRTPAGILASATLLCLLLASCYVPPGGVYVSSGLVQVPDLRGLDARSAAHRLKQYRLISGEVRYSVHRRIPQVVAAQNPEPGMRVPAWSYVSYTLAPHTAPPASLTDFADIRVPNLLGMTQEQAMGALGNLGFVFGGATWSSSPQAVGTVISQSPHAGTTIAPASTVTVLLSSGIQARTVTVPTVLRLPRPMAEAKLRRHGLVVGTVTRAFTVRVPLDCVASQDPAPNTQVPEGAAVNLVIASVKPQRRVRVPNVVGMGHDQAVQYIQGAGFGVGLVRRVPAPGRPVDSVVSQSPEAGTLVDPGSAVNLQIAQAPRTVAVPRVVGLTPAAASAVLARAGLRPGSVGKQVVNHGAGLIISQNPTAGLQVAAGGAVNLVVGVAPAGIQVPSIVGLSLDQARNALARSGFALGSVGRQDPGHGHIANNTVIDQNPEAGAILPRGSRVNITIAWHEARSVRVPSLRGKGYREALERLSDAGLRVGQVEHRTVVPGQVGKVIDQNPSPNTQVWENTAVNLVVGVREKEKLVLVPACILLSESKAKRVIESKGLVAKVRKVMGIPRGRVIFQFPPPGTPVKQGSEVRIHVTK